MIVLGSAILGAILGALQAKKRKGKPLDLLQYAAIYAMIFAVVGLFITIILHRMAV
ncbi:hypothetical protein [uncultured Shimia sp.]|uniref:hypothetical protein n=1 Tax=uncultured Shimia sp. TaxID=573152 RepID=UPI00262F5C36|nr:hypothetical protein [uncultured Shimia sp.]